MPTSAKRTPALLVDTSIAVALVVEDHEAHQAVIEALRRRRLGLAGHAFFETYSVLTRLPGPARRSPADISRLLAHNFPESRFLDAEGTAELPSKLADLRIAGGAVYDALVGATAAHHRLTLATRDERALETYRALEVDLRVIG